MKNKGIIIVAAVIVILLSVFLVLKTQTVPVENKNESVVNPVPVINYINEVKPDLSCAKAGEVIGTCVGCVSKCCEGLRGMSRLKYDGKCIAFPAPGLGATCSKCGDGICNKQTAEDECNCPVDCK